MVLHVYVGASTMALASKGDFQMSTPVKKFFEKMAKQSQDFDDFCVNYMPNVPYKHASKVKKAWSCARKGKGFDSAFSKLEGVL